MGILTWFAATLRQYPEIAIFLTLAIGYYFSKFSFKGIGLGSVSAAVLGAIGEPNAGLTTFSQAPVVTPRQIQFALKLDF
jgi:putative transport protein